MILLVAACGTGTNKNSSADSIATSSTTDITANPDYVKGLALVTNSDCLTCHQVEEKVTGPAFRAVADKYAGNDTAVTYLAHKIINGGGGVWGTVEMIPHNTLSESDAEQIVKYILLLKTK
jgi:cytochrome c